MKYLKILLLSPYFVYSLFISFVGVFTHFVLATSIMLFFGKKGPFVHRLLAGYFIRFIFLFHGLRVRFHNAEVIPKSGPLILAPNHESMLDVASLVSTPGRPTNFIAKFQVIFFPILGLDSILGGDFLLKREDAKSAYATMKKVEKAIVEKNKCMVVFPEGTRSITGKMGPFKRGSFKLAIETKSTVIPVYIRNSGKILPKNQLIIKPGRIDIVFGDPIVLAGRVFEDKLAKRQACDMLSDQVRNSIESMKAEWDAK
ncbi:1-acyl-sn-glycerol-3-phosphate acyltransferase [bacterium]|jgi:1-acyl-sn-glycerol-3-phosphate acyltransferase|nr:1-acyl-sn-glycerol-3-phosphate acyltransferase [bacterium]